jgi:hypothetical protein
LGPHFLPPRCAQAHLTATSANAAHLIAKLPSNLRVGGPE